MRSKKHLQFTVILLISFFFYSFIHNEKQEPLKHPLEKHLKNIRQLTFGGDNAEAYFSFDETKLIFQSTRDSFECDQIFIINIDGSDLRLVSTGKGKTTCSYFLPGDTEIIYSSTHHISEKCPPKPDYSKGYVWKLEDYDIFKAKADGSNLRQLTSTPGYDAEATVSPKGDKIVFTSMRDGDLEIYTMDLDGKNVKRLTFEKGYDGGAFFSWDGKKICYRAYHPKDSAEITEYEQLLKEKAIKPMNLQIFVMDADGSNKRQITNNNAANFAPFFHPDGKRIIFSSNMHDPKGRDFDLYMVNIETGEIERVTYFPDFDGFPMFTHDGKKLVWASNRNSKKRGETNIFIADWID